MFGHTVRSPLNAVKEKWLSEATKDTLEYVSKFNEKLISAFKIAQKNLVVSQNKMKTTYDANTKVRSFKPGDRVLMFLPIPNQSLHAKFFGPYVIEEKNDDLDYVVLTPDRRKKKRICHVNMIKGYIEKNNSNTKPALMLTDNGKGNDQNQNAQSVVTDNNDYGEHIPHLKNSEIKGNLGKK